MPEGTVADTKYAEHLGTPRISLEAVGNSREDFDSCCDEVFFNYRVPFVICRPFNRIFSESMIHPPSNGINPLGFNNRLMAIS